jgi:hypothetical protein
VRTCVGVVIEPWVACVECVCRDADALQSAISASMLANLSAGRGTEALLGTVSGGGGSSSALAPTPVSHAKNSKDDGVGHKKPERTPSSSLASGSDSGT